MNQTALAFERLIEKIVAWAEPRPDIRLAVVLGSRARTKVPADELSDLDIVLVVDDPDRYLNNTDWLKDIGRYKITFIEPTSFEGTAERRVLFEDGLDVDFSIVSAAQLMQGMQDSSTSDVLLVYARGYRVILDKAGIVPSFDQTNMPVIPSRLLSPDEFQQDTSDFCYHAVWTARKLKRGELWTAMRCCDFYMKRLLLRVIECHAQVMNGEDYDTWYDGRFLERWADRRIVEGLRDTYARFDEADIRRALIATMELFRWVTREIAERLDYPYPAVADEYATELVGALLPE